MTQTRNTAGNDGPDWVRMGVCVAIFFGVSSFIFDVLKAAGHSHNGSGTGLQAIVYTAVLFSLFFLVKALLSKSEIKRASLTFIAVCACGLSLIHFVDAMAAPLPPNGIAQTQDQL